MLKCSIRVELMIKHDRRPGAAVACVYHVVWAVQEIKKS